jgi:hypothetical protein
MVPHVLSLARRARVTAPGGRGTAGGHVTAAALLDRLDGVRQTGPGRWIARCPAHEDRSPSLSIRELDDGRTLIHCFAQCDALDIVQAAGIALSDLMPERSGHHTPPTRSRIPASDVLVALDHEAHVVAVIGADIIEHRYIDEPTWERLALAVQRIGDARAQTAPPRMKVTT